MIAASKLSLTTEQVSEATGVSIPSIKEYLRKGLVEPMVPSKGKRQRNEYGFKEAMVIKIVKLLSDTDTSRSLIGPIILGTNQLIGNRDRALVSDLTTLPLGNPFEIDFPSFQKKRILQLNDFHPVLLKLGHCITFCKVGFHYPTSQQKESSYQLIKLGDIPKIISWRELNKTEQQILHDSISPYPMSEYLWNLTRVHFEIRSKLISMGLA